MAAIRSKHTKPELAVRSLLRQMGFRYRLHGKNLPGKPDLVITEKRMAIFVHGCFWHMHRCRFGRVIPVTNAKFWSVKRLGNVQRDRKNLRALKSAGWRVLTLWECWTKNPEVLLRRVESFLRGNPRGSPRPGSRASAHRTHSVSASFLLR